MLITALASLLIGAAVALYVQQRHFEREKAGIVRQVVEDDESADRKRALMALRAIEVIQSGDTQLAMRLLSTPVAHYYTVYEAPGGDKEKRAETRTLIEQLAKTNQIVAARIAELSTK
jgi:hypothetical protein